MNTKKIEGIAASCREYARRNWRQGGAISNKNFSLFGDEGMAFMPPRKPALQNYWLTAAHENGRVVSLEFTAATPQAAARAYACRQAEAGDSVVYVIAGKGSNSCLYRPDLDRENG